LIEKTGRYLIFEWLLPSRKHLDLSAGVLRLYQMAGLQGSVRRSAIIKALWPELYNMNQLLPQVPSRAERRPPRSEFRAVSQYRGRIALFIGCVMQAFYPQMNRSAAELLAATGCEVMVPLEQCCCGAVHLHSGEERKTMALARKNIESFENTGASMLVVDSAGCGALLKEYGLLLKDDPRYASRAEDFAGKVVDIAEYLDRSTLNGNLGRLNMNVVYDEPCHLIHVQGISEEPKALLKSIPGLTLMPLEEADKCYSGAGIYNITQWEFSMRLLDRKMNLIKKARPDAIVTANPGCLIQLGYGARRWKLEIPVLHTVELLRMAYNV
jgi:glycolate oxidase iron-sulfur subunit